jgi:signal transduction histidine kinase
MAGGMVKIMVAARHLGTGSTDSPRPTMQQSDIHNRNAQLESLYRLSRILSMPLDYRERARRILDELLRVTEGHRVVMRAVDEKQGYLMLVDAVGRDLSKDPLSQALPMSAGAVGQAYREGRAIIINDYPTYSDAMAGVVDLGIKSIAALPIKSEDKLLGVITIESFEPNYFGQEMVRLITAITDELGILMSHARALELERYRTLELDALFQIARILVNADTVERKAESVLRVLCQVATVQHAVLRFFDKEKHALRKVAAVGYPDASLPAEYQEIGYGIVGAAFNEGRAVIVNDLGSHSWRPPGLLAAGMKSFMVVPIEVGIDLLGTISMASPQLGHFNEDRAKLVVAIANGAGTLLENARLHDVVKTRALQLQALSQKLVTVQEQEKKSLARELHDEIGQELTGLKMMLESISISDRDLGYGSLNEPKDLVDGLINRVRNLSLDLRPVMLDYLGLLPALFWQFERYTQQSGIHVEFEHSGLEHRFKQDIETAAYRIVQEALTNVARHANVKTAQVKVWVDGEMLAITIKDEGDGFQMGQTLTHRYTTGLANMRERVTALGGKFAIHSGKNIGAEVMVRIPLDTSMHQDRDQA